MDVEETTLLNGTVRLLQPKKGFRACIDTVLVAAFSPAKLSHKVLDLGCGVGGAGLCLNQRINPISLYGMEVDTGYAELAKKNYADNKVSGDVMVTDIRDRVLEHRESFDQILCNPPYMVQGDHLRSPDDSKARAMGQGQGEASLDDWMAVCRYYLKPMGALTLIQRADMLADIVQAFGQAYGSIEILPIFSKADQPSAKRVLIRAIKGRKTGSSILSPLVVHEDDGVYSQNMEKLLRNASSLPIVTE